MYTPICADLDADSFLPQHDRRERIEDASGVILKSTGTGTIAGKPAYLVPGLTETLLSARIICQTTCPQHIDDNFLLTTSDTVYCIDRNLSKNNIFDYFHQHVKINSGDLKFTAFQNHGVYTVATDAIKQLAGNDPITRRDRKIKKKAAKRIRRYKTIQFKTLAALVLYWHENLGHVDADKMVNNGKYSDQQSLQEYTNRTDSNYYA